MSDDPARPARATRGLAWTRADFAALDVERTGPDAERDALISFGVVPVRDGRVVLADSVSLEDSPPMPEVRPVLADALAGRYLLTWSAEVEAAFLAQVFPGSARSWLRRSIDVSGLAMLLDRVEGTGVHLSGYSLGSVAERFGVPAEQPHHALDDALTTAQLFLILAQMLRGRGPNTPRRLIRLSRRGRGSVTT